MPPGLRAVEPGPPSLMAPAKLLILMGLVLVVLGCSLGGVRWFGHLPGDLTWRRGTAWWQLPIVSSILLSLILTLVLNLLLHFLVR